MKAKARDKFILSLKPKAKLRVGFDMDGVLIKTFPRHRELIKEMGDEYRRFIQTNGKPNHDMIKLLHKFEKYGSDCFIISGRAGKEAHARTKTWLYGHTLMNYCDEALFTNVECEDFIDINADKTFKAFRIMQLNLDCYFEDNQEIIEHLRANCPNCQIIKVVNGRPTTD